MDYKVEQQRRNLSKAEYGSENARVPQEDIPEYVLLPGDPKRVSLMASQWDEGTQEQDLIRGYRSAIGQYKGTPLAAFSTGIGAPSSEGTIMSLASSGVHTYIRVGTTGAIQENIKIGDIIINDSSVRLDGTSRFYVRDEYPAAASFEVTMALVQACENLGLPYHVGTGCTCGSFYAGQCRTSFGGYRPSHLDNEFQDMKAAKVLNFEMEGAGLFTMARIFGLRAGMCASVIAHRLTGEWDDASIGEKNACLAGAEAIRILTEWDVKKHKARKAYFFPGLL